MFMTDKALTKLMRDIDALIAQERKQILNVAAIKAANTHKRRSTDVK